LPHEYQVLALDLILEGPLLLGQLISGSLESGC
jgi:hypothetical protein